MIKKIREQVWFVKGFLKKYSKQIVSGILITILFSVLINIVSQKLPNSKSEIKIGIVGQWGAGQLPTTIIDFLNAGLININKELKPVPNLARDWTVDETGKNYTFYLNQDLKWSSGKDVKTSDIKFSIPNIIVETQDPNVIKFTIPTKFSPFISLLNIPLLNERGEIIGPYDISLKQKSSGLITQVNLNSKSQKIVYQLFSTAKQAITSYKLGQINLVLNIPAEYQDDLEKYGSIRKKTDFNRVVILIFNQLDPNLKQKNIRQGIAYAIKDKIFGETAAITTQNPNSWAFSPLVKTYSYNPERAKELIGSPLTLDLATMPELLTVAENLKAQLDSDLLKINIKVVSSTPDQFQLLLTTYSIPADPDQYKDWHSTQTTNIGHGADEKIDKLLEDGRVNLDQKERKLIYIDFQKTFSEELPALVLYHPSVIDVGRNDSLFTEINRD